VKTLLVLLALASSLQAELLAHFQTSAGNITVALQYEKSPLAVANFITLAQGTRARIHPTSGAVIQSPMYLGEKFFRVVNTDTFKIIQTGSGTGSNNGGPGFTFKDELDPSLSHVPYVLSMANSGANTNGSQIFFTGNASATHLDGVHTIFGLVTDAASRNVIDAIHLAGENVTTITGITFSRTDPAALAFQEHAQNLPTVIRPAGNLEVTRNVSAMWNFNTPITTGDVLRAYRSITLGINSWTDLTNGSPLHIGIGSPLSPPQFSSVTLDNASLPSAFYHLSVARHPGSVTPSSLNGRVFEIETTAGAFRYSFNSQGNGGTGTYFPYQGDPFSFPFGLLEFRSGAHEFSCTVENGLEYPRYLLIKNGCDLADNTIIFGRHSTYSYEVTGWQPFDVGESAMTR
jgi:peptidyl-prolyl cis-trans isomerase A (cyclophilin A)